MKIRLVKKPNEVEQILLEQLGSLSQDEQGDYLQIAVNDGRIYKYCFHKGEYGIQGSDEKTEQKNNFIHWILCNFNKIEKGEYSYPMRQSFDMNGPEKYRTTPEHYYKIKPWIHQLVSHEKFFFSTKGSEVAKILVRLPEAVLRKTFLNTDMTIDEIWSYAYPNNTYTSAEREVRRYQLLQQDITNLMDKLNTQACDKSPTITTQTPNFIETPNSQNTVAGLFSEWPFRPIKLPLGLRSNLTIAGQENCLLSEDNAEEVLQICMNVTYGLETFEITRIQEKLDGKNKSKYDGTYVKKTAYDRINSLNPNDYTKDDGVFFLKMMPEQRSKAVEGFAEMLLGEMIGELMRTELIPKFYWDCFSPATTITLPNNVGKALLQPFAIGSKPLHQASKKYDHILILHPDDPIPISIPENRIVLQLKDRRLAGYWNEASIIKHKSLSETKVPEIIEELRAAKDIHCSDRLLVEQVALAYKLIQKQKPTFTESQRRFFSNQGYEVYYNSIEQESHGLSYVLMFMILFGNYSVHSGNIQVTLESEQATYTGIDYGAGVRNLGDSYTQTKIWQALEELTKVRSIEALTKLRPHRFFTKRYLDYYKIPGLLESVQQHGKDFLEALKAEPHKKSIFEQIIVESIIKSYRNYNDEMDETRKTDLLKYVYGDYYPIYAEKRRDSLFDVSDFADDICSILYGRLREMVHQKVPILPEAAGRRLYKSISIPKRGYIEDPMRPELSCPQEQNSTLPMGEEVNVPEEMSLQKYCRKIQAIDRMGSHGVFFNESRDRTSAVAPLSLPIDGPQRKRGYTF